MLSQLRTSAVLLVVLVLGAVAGCSATPAVPGGTEVTETVGGLKGVSVPLATGTCWTDAVLGADPQAVLNWAKQYKVTYFDAAHALAQRPAFALTQACASQHSVEVYKVVAMKNVGPKVTSYAALLKPAGKALSALDANVDRACMNKVLFDAAAKTGLNGAVMTPAFPAGVELDWSPPSPEQWEKGQRVYACTMKQTKPGTLRYDAIFSSSFPTAKRTCIDGRSLVYVDCARKHQRERISVLDLRTAVAAGQLPGHRGIETGPDGRFLDLTPTQYAALDRSCSAYLKSVSTTKKLSGVAEVDVDQWPTEDGHYLVSCEADRPTTKNSVTTQGSVFNRN